MALGDIWRATVQFDMPETTIAQWVQHYQQATAGSPSATDIATQIAAMVTSTWSDITTMVDPEVTGDTVEVALWDAVAKEFNTLATASINTLAGTATAEMLPHQEAAVVLFFTNVGRSIGKKFVFGLAENQQENSILTAGAITNLILWAAGWDNTLNVGGSTIEPGNFNLLTEAFRAYVKTIAVNAVLGSQDRRRPGIGI